MKKKPTPIRTLAQAERWCVKNNAVMRFWPKACGHRWEASAHQIKILAICWASTPVIAVERLRRKVEKAR